MTPLPERNLDVLRAIAVLCVVALHTSLVVYGATPPQWLTALGHVGVLLFFVHTSLVLMASIERLEARGPWLRAFYIRRAFRIYPLAMATVLAVVAFGWPARAWLDMPVIREPGAVVSNLFLVQNLLQQRDVLVVLWSLPVEVQMYVVLPALYMVARSGARALWPVLVVAIVAATAVLYGQVPGYERLSVLVYAPCFLAGILAYSGIQHRPSPRQLWRGWGPALLVATVFGIGGVALFNVGRAGAADWGVALLVGLLIPRFREMGESWFTRAAATVAKYSYGIYLFHIPATYIALSWKPGAPAAARWAALAVLFVVLPWLAFHGIESPGIRLGQRVAGRILTAPTPLGSPLMQVPRTHERSSMTG